VRTGTSAAAACAWNELVEAENPNWRLDAYLPQEAFSALQEQLNQLDLDDSADETAEFADPVLLRIERATA
jgi:hypothetical protein